MKNTFKISVDLKKSVPLKTPIITEGDSVKFEVSVFDDGKVFDLSNSSRCVLLTVKPDGNVTAKDGSVVRTNKIEFNLGYLETGMAGKVKSIIQVYDLEGRVSSFPFSFIVKNDPSNDYVSKSPDIPLLQTLINETKNLFNTLTQKSDYAKTQGGYAKTQGDYASSVISNVQNVIDNMKYLGSYDNTKTYYKNNVVEYNGSSYIAKTTTNGNTPVGDSNDVYWGILAKRGLDGSGSVVSVNNKSPDESGNVTVTASDVGAETPSGAQVKADQAEVNAKNYFDSQKGQPNGVATLDENGKVINADGTYPSGVSEEDFVAHSTETASKFTNINLNIIDMAVELETLKGATLNGVTANIFIETFTNLNDINLMNGGYDSVNKRLVV